MGAGDAPIAEPTSTSTSARSRALSVWGLSFLVLSTLSIVWALASPVFSVPDEVAHAVKAIGQLQGQVVGRTVDGIRHLVVDLEPEDAYQGEMLCFVDHPGTPASCGAELGDPGGAPWFNTWVGTYNPSYYYLVGWPSLFLDGNASVYAMRIASALIGSAFLASAFLLAVSGRRARWLPLGVAFAAAPMNLYLIGSVNPNGLEIAASVALWVGVLRLLEFAAPDAAARSGPSLVPRTATWCIVAVSAITVANVRALGPLWVLVVVALAALIAGWAPVRRLFTARSSLPWLIAIAAGGLFSVLWTMFAGSLSSQAEPGDAPLVGEGPIAGIGYMIRMTPDYLQQAAGWFGWLDTVLPAWTYWLIAAAVAVPVVLAFTGLRRRSTLVFAVVVAAAWLVPIIVQARSVSQTGIIWQGRYGIFLYLGVLIVAGWLLSGREARRLAHLSPRVAPIGASLVAAFGLYAFWFVMIRYVVGLDSAVGTMWTDPQWQPPLGWPTLVAAYAVGSAAFVLLVAWLAHGAARRDPDEQPVPAPTDGATVDVRG
jgi:hypothetical protein